ncbi:MAG: ABC transporter permease [Nanoarchaeota archaeon]
MISAVIALAKREARRDLSDKGRMMFDIAWPLMILIVLGFGVDAFAPPKAGLPYWAFLGAGMIGLLIMRQAYSFGSMLEHEARVGYREYLVTPVQRHWIIIGSFLGRWTVQSLLALAVLAAYSAAFQVFEVSKIAWAAIAVVISVGCGLSIGLAMSVWIKDLRDHALKSWLVAIALALVSGVFFPVSDLPFGIWRLSYISPLTYMIDWIRGAMIGVSALSPMSAMIITAGVGAVCLSIGIWKSERLFRL